MKTLIFFEKMSILKESAFTYAYNMYICYMYINIKHTLNKTHIIKFNSN